MIMSGGVRSTHKPADDDDGVTASGSQQRSGVRGIKTSRFFRGRKPMMGSLDPGFNPVLLL